MDIRVTALSEVYDTLVFAAECGSAVRVYTTGGVFDGIPEFPKGAADISSEALVRPSPLNISAVHVEQAKWNNLRLHAYLIEGQPGSEIVVRRDDVNYLRLFASQIIAAVPRAARGPVHVWYDV